MTRIVMSVPSLTGGLSRQPSLLQLNNQALRSSNTLASLVEGLKRRPPCEYQRKLTSVPSGDRVFHPIDSLAGRFLVVAGSSDIKVYDVDAGGAALTLRNKSNLVATGADLAYLSTSDPQADLRFLTLADYTLILNRSKTPAMSSTLVPANPSQAQVVIVLGAYSTRYHVSITHAGGTRTATLLTYSADGTPPGGGTPDSTNAAVSVRPDIIASRLVTLLTSATAVTGGSVTGTALGAGWTIESRGPHLLVKKNDGAEITASIETTDERMVLIHKKVQLFTDLPTHSQVGWRVEVEGDVQGDTSSSSYWVEFVPQSPGVSSGWAEGYWREASAPGLPVGLDPDTMPMALIRQANGEWRITPLDGHSYVVSSVTYTVPTWDARAAGDNDTNPNPKFVGKNILGMCFHQGRLGLLSEETLSMSETREPFSFFRTSVLDLIPSDRFEVSAATPRGERLQFATPVSDSILLFSEGTQFLVRAETWAPDQVRVETVGRYGIDPQVEPIQVRDAVMAATPRGEYSALLELRIAGDARASLASADLSASIPAFLPQPSQLIHGPQTDYVMMRSGDLVDVLTTAWNGDQRVLNAWQTWDWDVSLTAIRWCWVWDTDFWMLATVGGESHLFKTRLEVEARDGSDLLVHLDRRVDSSQCTVSYANGETSYVLPFTAHAGTQAVAEGSKQLAVNSVVGSTVKVAGNHTTEVVRLGIPYLSQHDPVQTKLVDESQATVLDGTLRHGHAVVSFDGGPFTAYVSYTWQNDAYAVPFSGPWLGQGANYQSMRTVQGTLTVPIRARAADAFVSFRTSSPWPMRLLSMDVVGTIDGISGTRR